MMNLCQVMLALYDETVFGVVLMARKASFMYRR